MTSQPKPSSTLGVCGAALQLGSLSLNQSLVFPNEIKDEVVKYLSPGTLASLCCVSKDLNKRFTKQLYENVDLIYHEECRCVVTDDNKCYNKQRRFLQTLKTRPEYAKYVKTFKWTLVYCSENYRYRYENLPLLPSYSKKAPCGVWDIFRTLTEVTSVEIAEWDSCDETREYMVPTLSLFPKAVSVGLLGNLTDTFVDFILPINKISQLQHLYLEDFQTFAAGLTSTEATSNFLNGLVGKCTALKTLTVIDSEVNLDDPTADRPTEWKAFARFLGSVKGTLEVFYFKIHGGILDTELFDPELYREPIQRMLDNGTWPRLRKVTILPPAQ